MVVDTVETRRKVKELQEETVNVMVRGYSGRRREVLDEINALHFRHSVLENRSFLEERFGAHGVDLEHLCSIFTVKLPHSNHSGVLKPLKTCLTQY